MNDLAVCVFAFNRPVYLGKCLGALENQVDTGGFDLHTFHDGCVNPFTGRRAALKEHVDQCIAVARDSNFPVKHLHVRKDNRGVATQQYEAYNLIADNYRWALWLEEDVITSPYFVRVARLLIPFLMKDPDAFSATPSFMRYNCSADQIGDRLTHVEEGKSPWVGYLADMTKWARVKMVFDEYYAMVRDCDYRRRPHTQIREWYRTRCDWPGQPSSQDGGKEASIEALGMRRYRCRVNRGFYIGESGEHGSPGLYKKQGWAQHVPYIHDRDETVTELELVT